MKKKFLLLPLVAGLLCAVLSSYETGPGLNGVGDRTGATLSTVGCGSGCHASLATLTTTVLIELYDATNTTKITTGYVGGTAYTIRMTGTNTSTTAVLPKFGFQVSAVKTSSTSTNEGTLSAIASTHKGAYGTPPINIVEHSTPLSPTYGTGGMGTTYVVAIPWTAPTAGSGSVTVFGVLNAVNNDGIQDAADLWNNSSLVVPEATISSVDPITGTMTVCVGATTPLSDGTTGGTWSSSNTAVATIGYTGIVTGVAGGTATITYNDGLTGNATATVTVNTVPAPAAITGGTVVCVSTHIILSDATAGGVWSSSTTAFATAGATTGVVIGIAAGVDTIKYTVTNSCGTGSITHTVTVKTYTTACVEGVSTVQNPLQAELKVFPNPNYGTFTMNLLSDNDEQANVVITNIVGQQVKAFTTVTNKEIDINIAQPVGIYFVAAATQHGIYVAKVVVQ